MDFLGLRTLTVIQNAVKMAKKRMPDLDIDKIDYNDQDVLDYIGTGKTDGIFQIESAGMKGFMKELKPHSLEDIIAGISCTVRDRWILFRSISKEKMMQIRSHTTARS